ncbi:hypothetical protein Salmuc_05574 [Salipiger mucosus DSM 16094]|uniref:Uncharacterized protein n=1 Tax=Salipiger mucosus DSM 16094 TaxID=1123237 RepID=S9S091_9RHOB|nr:hypothetical protein Salmuc_05574 [Salipiger mucosus DSM 16094]
MFGPLWRQARTVRPGQPKRPGHRNMQMTRLSGHGGPYSIVTQRQDGSTGSTARQRS